MPPLRRPLLAGLIAASLGCAVAPVRGRAVPAIQRTPTAHCSDGTYYYGPKSRRACAHHRGVSEWLAASNRGPARRGRAAGTGRAAGAPGGATARCRDGSYSFVRNRKQACTSHRGIARWLRAR
jgi:Protein of unknown function (DUF3761)